jgi:hypothetical protein
VLNLLNMVRILTSTTLLLAEDWSQWHSVRWTAMRSSSNILCVTSQRFLLVRTQWETPLFLAVVDRLYKIHAYRVFFYFGNSPRCYSTAGGKLPLKTEHTNWMFA